ncbi:MAG: DUF3320 domain-containing protein [Fimbriimonadaceae bacterium]|nr:DUF3320 domain-containing protein [Fimbriimonadaceae bacterium]
MDSVKAQYEALRKKLLDTSLRNRMVSYRPARVSGIEVRGEDPGLIFKIVVEAGRAMSFSGVPDPPKAKAAPGDLSTIDSPDAMAEFEAAARDELQAFLYPEFVPEPNAEDGGVEPRVLATTCQTDSKLATPHTVSNLLKRLTKLYRDSTALTEETGLNALYLALGALIWRESDASEVDRIAPLVFVPVRLERTANGHFKVAHDGGDIGSNLTMSVLAKEQFGLELPLREDEEALHDYFVNVAGRVEGRSGWRVDPTFVALGFFQFTKLVMYEDLEESRWSETRRPTLDGDVRALLGDGYGHSDDSIGPDDMVDDVRPVEACHEVYDCDSSQVLAMIRAQSGRSMVIEGPPGTGKSQTIANLIAEFVASGKKVLFVSEKMAALDVVFRRLSQAGLGDACLELHSRSSKRREFYEELKRVMGISRTARQAAEVVDRYARLRNELNGYAAAVNEMLEPFGLTPHEAIGLNAKLPPEDPTDVAYRVAAESLRSRSWSRIQEDLPVVKDFERHLGQMGVPNEHPFLGCELSTVTPGDVVEVRGALEHASVDLSAALDAANSLSGRLCLPAPKTVGEIETMARCTEIAIKAPHHDGVAVKLESWEAEEASLRAHLGSLELLQRLARELDAVARPELWTARLDESLVSYRLWAPRWYRFVSGSYRRASRQVSALLKANLGPMETLAVLEKVAVVQAERAKLGNYEPTLRRMFGVQWRGEASNVADLRQLLDWVLGVRKEAREGRVPPGLLDFFEANHSANDLVEQVTDVRAKCNSAKEAVAKLYALLQISPVPDDLVATLDKVRLWETSLDRLPEIARYNQINVQLQELGLGTVVQVAQGWENAPDRLAESFERSYLEMVLKEALNRHPELAGFSREGHEEKIRDFRRLDEIILKHNRAKVIAAHLRGMPNWELSVGNMSLLRRQTELRRGHKPIRWAMEKAGEAIQRMKPVFLMSPLSVALFLPREDVHFDVVIFDEASQVKPEDALSAIVRAEQTIVVGDSKQMPPTSFFDKLMHDDETEEDEQVASIGQLESILALMASVVRGTARTSDLRWHYRSKHPALIEPSNVNFYDSRLVVFPSPEYRPLEAKGGLGLRWHYDSSHTYDRGKSRKNLGQAAAVAQAVLAHVREHPDESLGVAALSAAQQEAIQDALELVRRQHPGELEPFDERHPFERLFVKNLESVQGDERDVIFISIGYGRDEKGYFAMNFGPINADGGERRLNVLMSRARRRCEVFSSMTSGDITLSESPSQGTATLKMFLQFAETGELDMPRPSQREADSDFEVQVVNALRARGYAVDPQVGSLGFFIDLAIRHPEKPGSYVLGVECDGASYHSARSARDRDKLRQHALEDRGWTIHRIWSTDWWRNPDAEIERCVAAIETALAGEAVNVQEAIEDTGVLVEDFLIEAPPAVAGAQPYQRWTRPFDLGALELQGLPPALALNCIRAILGVEGPMHEDHLILRMRESAGLARAGSRVRDCVMGGVHAGVHEGSLVYDAPFVSLAAVLPPRCRDRSGLPPSERKTEWVAPEELRTALITVVREACGTSADEAISVAWKLLGFSRVSESARNTARLQVDTLVASGVFAVDGDLFLLKP